MDRAEGIRAYVLDALINDIQSAKKTGINIGFSYLARRDGQVAV